MIASLSRLLLMPFSSGQEAIILSGISITVALLIAVLWGLEVKLTEEKLIFGMQGRLQLLVSVFFSVAITTQFVLFWFIIYGSFELLVLDFRPFLALIAILALIQLQDFGNDLEEKFRRSI